MARKMMWPVLVIGIAMVVVPFAISLPGRASSGETMLNDFHPIMQRPSVNETVAYYYDTFVPLRQVATGAVQAAAEEPAMMAAFAHKLHMSTAQVGKFLSTSFPAIGGLLSNLPKLTPVFSKVPAGLDHYLPLVQTMQKNVNNYKQIDSLPKFTLFTWFFVVPGALLIVIAGVGLGVGETKPRLAA
ncbi:MAG: hypothetical protein ACP5H2_11780 [Solirubrobacteraceae bacterium]